MATYTKAGAGIAGLPWYQGAKFGSGAAGLTGAGTRRGTFAKRASGVAGLTAGGYRGGRVVVKTGCSANPWVEPPFMEDWFGIRPVGKGWASVTRSGGGKTGRAAAGGVGRGARVRVFTKKGTGAASGSGVGRRSSAGYVKRGVAVIRPNGYGYSAARGFIKRGGGVAGVAGSGYSLFRVVAGRILLKVGAWDDVAVAGVSLLVDGVQYGDEVTQGLDSKVLNGRFDSDATGWSAVGGSTVTRVTSGPKYGAGCLSVAVTSTGQGVKNDATKYLTVGKTYRAAGWVKGTAGEWVEFSLIRQSDSGAIGIGKGVAMDGSWQFFYFDADAASSEPHSLQAVSKTGSQTFFLDAVSVVCHAEFVVDTAPMTNGGHVIGAIVRDAAGHLAVATEMDVAVRNVAVAEPRLVVEIAFDSNPRDDLLVWTDVTDDFVEGQWGHGRSQVLSRMEAGQLSLRLRNHHRHYDNVNPDSPYVGKVVVGKRVRTSAVYNDAIYRRFTGSISKWEPEWVAGGKGAYMVVSAVDDFTPMARAKISSAKAALTTTLGAGNDIVLTSLYGGGNDISITLVNPGTTGSLGVHTQTVTEWVRSRTPTDSPGDESNPSPFAAGPEPTLEVTSRDITVTLAYSGGITTTAQELVDAINSDAGANGWVIASLAQVSGSAIVGAFPKTNLAGGGRAEESSGDRVGWALDGVGIPEENRLVDAGTVMVQAAALDRQSSLDYVQAVEATELGQFFFDGEGRAVFHDQDRRTDAPVKHTYADMPSVAAGEHLYLNAVPTQGSELVYNDIEVSAPGLPTAKAIDEMSAEAYWPSAYDETTLLTTYDELLDRAVLLLGRFKLPVDNLRAMLLDPMREAVAYGSTTAWPHALALEVSNKLHVRRSPPGGGELLYETFVESVADAVSAEDRRTWVISVGMSVAYQSGSMVGSGSGGAPGRPWVLEDAEYGILDQTTRLA